MSATPAPGEVARRIGGSAFWTTASSVGSQIIRFALFVMLSRLVTPRDFGVVALASVVIDLLSVVAIGGVSDALVRKEALNDGDTDTAFWLKMAGGVVFFLAGLALSPLIAAMFKTPQLAPVLSALCFTLLIWPLGATHTSRLSRDLQLRALAIRTLVANIIGAGAGIALALRGYGVWALVARSLITTAALVVMGWIAFPWMPRFRFRKAAFRELSGFGSKLMGAQLVSQANARGIEVIAGLMIAPTAVGLLRIGGQCFNLLTQITVVPLSSIALPLLARTQGDEIAGREVFAKICRLSALMIYPVFFGTMAISDLVFPLIFSAKWALTGAMMPLLCAMAIPLQFNMLMTSSLASRGAAGSVLRWNTLQAAVGLPLSAIGALHGLFPLLWFTAARSYLLLPIGLLWLKRETGLSPRVMAASSMRALIASLAMAAIVYAAKRTLHDQFPPVILLGVLILLGGAVYPILALATDGSLRADALDAWRTRGL